MTTVEDAEMRVPCPYCRELILPGAIKCRHCQSGLPQSSASNSMASAEFNPSRSAADEARSASIPEGVRQAFKKYAVISGRATRLEFWSFQLFLTIVGVSLAIFTTNNGLETYANRISILFNLATIVPWTTAASRRLHDVNRSAKWLLLLLTVIGAIPVIYWLASKGTNQPNRFGPAPRLV